MRVALQARPLLKTSGIPLQFRSFGIVASEPWSLIVHPWAFFQQSVFVEITFGQVPA